MKLENTMKLLAIVVMILLFHADAFAQGLTWYRDADMDGWGDASTSTSSSTQPSGYVLNKEDCDDSRYNNTAWSKLGNKDISDTAMQVTKMAMDTSGNLYVAYVDSISKLIVKKFDGSKWTTLGAAGFSAGMVSQMMIAIARNGTPYVCFADMNYNGKITVMKFNGTNWVLVGSAAFSSDAVYNLTLAIDNSNVPYVAYSGLDNYIRIRKFDGTNWAALDSSKFLSVFDYVGMVIDGSNKPYLFYLDSYRNSKATVVKFNGTNWDTVGTAGFSAASLQYDNQDIALDNTGTPYVIYQDQSKGYKVTVMKYDGTNWVNVGTPGFSTGQVSGASIAIDKTGIPYASYVEGFNTVIETKKFNGTDWVSVGAYISSGHPVYPDMIIDNFGVPYVTYQNLPSYGGKAPVMKLSAKSFTPQIYVSANTTVVDSGNTISFTTYTGDGGATPIYQWYKNGQPINGANSSTYASGLLANKDVISCSLKGNGVCADTAIVFSNKVTITVNPVLTWYEDKDTDGWGNALISVKASSLPGNYVLNKEDCDDNRSNGTEWSTLATGVSDGRADYLKVAVNAIGTIYMAYSDSTRKNKATVMKFDGTNWVNVGSPGFSAGTAKFIDLVIDKAGVPYIAYSDGPNYYRTTVMKFNGTNWVAVGNVGFSSSEADYIKMALDNAGNPYVACGYSPYITVMKYDGTNWSTVGAVGSLAGIIDYLDFALDNSNSPYVVYTNDNGKIIVQQYKDGNWTVLGASGFSAGNIYYPSIVLDVVGTPYVAYQDAYNNKKLTVMKYDGFGWSVVGTSGFSAGQADYINLSIDPAGLPYVVYSDASLAGKSNIMKYDGANWVSVGKGWPSLTDLCINAWGVPYIAYRDPGNSNKASLVKLSPKWLNAEIKIAQTAITNSSITFTAQGNGGGNSPAYQWYKNRALISGATSSTYTINTAMDKDSIYCQMTSSDPCVIPLVYSNVIGLRAASTWYFDADSDGWGNSSASMLSFMSPKGYVLNKLDCDDSRPNGATWDNLGTANFSTSDAFYTNMCLDKADLPYLVYSDLANNWKATVMKYDGTNWVSIGTPGLSASNMFYPAIAIDPSGTPYIVYENGINGRKAVVKKYDGTNWVLVGTEGFSASQAEYTNLALDPAGMPYVVYQDWGYNKKATVMKYNGTDWVNVGNPGFSAGQADEIKIQIDGSGVPYVIYIDKANGGKATIMRYDGINWVDLGLRDLLVGPATFSMTINAGIPYVVYQDGSYNNKITVVKYENGTWSTVGLPAFSPSGVSDPLITIDRTGALYVSFEESINNIFMVTIMKYDGTSWKIYGAPRHSSLGLTFANLAITSEGIPYIGFTLRTLTVSTQKTNVIKMTPQLLQPQIVITASDSVISKGTTITFSAHTTYAGNAPVYKWYKNKVLIPGAVSNTYSDSSLVGKDTIYCKLSNTDDVCVDQTPVSSNKIGISLITSVNDPARSEMRMNIYPVPVDDVLHIQWINTTKGLTTVRVYDITGREMFSGTYQLEQSDETISLSLNHLVSGVYFVMGIVNGNPVPLQKIIKK